MSECITGTSCAPQGSALPIRAHVRNPVNGEPITIADVADVTVKVHDLSDLAETGDFELDEPFGFSDDLLEEAGWDYPDGFNFRYIVPGDAFPVAGTYLISLLGVDTDGNAIRHQWKHRATQVPGEPVAS